MTKVDILIVGTGAAGEYAAGYALGNGRSVGMVERARIGGACIFNACIPTKALIQAASTYNRMKGVDFFGLPPCREQADYRSVKQFKDGVIAGIGTGRDARWRERGARLFEGVARFKSPHEVLVGDDTIHADKIIVCTGSSPVIPPIPGLEEAGCITNIEALQLEGVPPRLVIIGGGAVGVEFAQIFSAFGSQVHILEMMDRVLAAEDADVSSAIEESMRLRKVTISTSVKVTSVKKAASGKVLQIERADGAAQALECDEILVAAGRKPSIEDLDLPAAGIRAGKRGIEVDASMQTGVPHIWAAGDVTGTYLFTYIAGEQGKTAALNATTGSRTELDIALLPRATYCDPEAASVGLTEAQAKEQGHKVKVGRFNYADLTRSIVSGDTVGFVKIVADESSGRILGGHIVGAQASNLIHEVAVAMVVNATASNVGNLLHAYPSFSEAVRYACQAIT
jgi:pyruvate/2-oxoglutarate dehydrogenase complex dihydrolipoamide dehydrogenase (E3) component